MDEAFYGTLPQDTQDFTQILRGVKRNLTDAARGVSYYPYDLIGAPVDIINMALTPIGLGSQQPVLGSDYLRNIAKSLGLAQDPTGSIAETTARIGAGFINPAAGARAVGQIPQQVTRGANITADKLVQMITQNPEATATRVIDETQMPFLNAVAPKAPSLLQPQKSDLGFYSQLEAATIPLQNKGTGEQYLAQLQKSAGVKPEEIKWTGLDEFLKGKDSVTKQEIQDYLQANRVDVQEVVRQDYVPSRAQILEFMKTERGRGLKDYEAKNELQMDRLGSGPSFPEYQLPGGRNYREILLTLPAEQLTEAEAKVVLGAAPDAKLSSADIAYASRKNVNEYRSSHFREPNILAHMRVNDRTVGGKKTLFIEEIQSDWHQAGRKQGYKDQRLIEKEKELLAEADKVAQNAGFQNALHAAEGWQMHGIEKAKEANDLYMAAKKQGVSPNAVPDAPFKTSWHELALKRAIQEASEKGYDQIAFTTGRTQAKRYEMEDASGMKGFYDNILPKSLEKLGKKFDAKVGKTKVGGVEVWQMDITPKMRESVTTKGQPLFAIPAIGTGLLGEQVMQEDQY